MGAPSTGARGGCCVPLNCTHMCAYTCFMYRQIIEARVAPPSVLACCCHEWTHFLPHDTNKALLRLQAPVAAPATAGQAGAAPAVGPGGPANRAPRALLPSPSTAVPQICSGCHTRLLRRPFPGLGFSAFGMEAEYMLLPGCPGMAFHPGCLICAACKTALTVRDKVAVEGTVYYHEDCLRKKRRPICSCCDERIASEVRSGTLTQCCRSQCTHGKHCNCASTHAPALGLKRETC